MKRYSLFAHLFRMPAADGTGGDQRTGLALGQELPFAGRRTNRQCRQAADGLTVTATCASPRDVQSPSRRLLQDRPDVSDLGSFCWPEPNENQRVSIFLLL